MRRLLFIATCVAALAAVLWERHAERNDEHAYFTRDGHVYRVELTGRRFPLVHDPLSLVLGRTHPASFTLDLPKIDGVIEGGDIRRSESARYLGRVVISNGVMSVDLYYPDERTRRPLSWNDEYTLVQKGTAGSR